MKTRQIITLILTIGALASCAKFEQGGGADDIRISYNVIRNKPSAKSSVYPIDVPFASYAWQLTAGKSWDNEADRADAQVYINKAIIQHQGGRWYDLSTDYYWPLNGSLSFMSYSPASIPDANVSADKTDGIKFVNWDVNANPTVDLMIADIAKDKSANETNGGFTGVPTIFRHKLAMIAGFRFNTFHDYANGHDGSSGNSYQNGDILFFIKSISINKLKQKGNYTSGPLSSAARLGKWTLTADATENKYTWYRWYSGYEKIQIRYSTTEGESIPANGLGGRDYLYVLPQEFDPLGSKTDTEVPHITIEYTKRTYSGASSFSDENITSSVALYDVLAPMGNEFQINKRITFNVTINLDTKLITWAPDYDEWTGDDYDISI